MKKGWIYFKLENSCLSVYLLFTSCATNWIVSGELRWSKWISLGNTREGEMITFDIIIKLVFNILISKNVLLCDIVIKKNFISTQKYINLGELL